MPWRSHARAFALVREGQLAVEEREVAKGQRHRAQEMPMSRASGLCPKKREVIVMFEPNRMVSSLLQSAYWRVAPVRRRPLGSAPSALAAPHPPDERADRRERRAP